MEGERWLGIDTSRVGDVLGKGLPRTCYDRLGNPEKRAWTPDLKCPFPVPSRPCWCWPPLPQHIGHLQPWQALGLHTTVVAVGAIRKQSL